MRENDIREFIRDEKSFYVHIVEDEQGLTCYAMNEKLREKNYELAKENGRKKKEDADKKKADTKKFLDDLYGIL